MNIHLTKENAIKIISNAIQAINNKKINHRDSTIKELTSQPHTKGNLWYKSTFFLTYEEATLAYDSIHLSPYFKNIKCLGDIIFGTEGDTNTPDWWHVKYHILKNCENLKKMYYRYEYDCRNQVEMTQDDFDNVIFWSKS